jgi:hypothetical protein
MRPGQEGEEDEGRRGHDIDGVLDKPIYNREATCFNLVQWTGQRGARWKRAQGEGGRGREVSA